MYRRLVSAHPQTETVYILLDAPSDRIEAAIDEAERTARDHVEQGSQWIACDVRPDDDELDDALLEEPLVWRVEDIEPHRALLVARAELRGEAGAPLAAAASRFTAAVAIEAELGGLSPLQEAVVRRVMAVDPGATVVNGRGEILRTTTDPSCYPPPPPTPARRNPTFDGGVDAELFRALRERGLLEVGPGFDADRAAAEWAAAGLEQNGEQLLAWLIDRADVDEVYASGTDLERAMAVSW